MMAEALVNGRVLIDGEFVTGRTVVIENGRIAVDRGRKRRRKVRPQGGPSCPASSIRRSTAAATGCSTTIRASRRSPRSAPRTGVSERPASCRHSSATIGRRSKRRWSAVRIGNRAGRARRARNPHRGPVPQRREEGHPRGVENPTNQRRGHRSSLAADRREDDRHPRAREGARRCDPPADRCGSHRLRRAHESVGRLHRGSAREAAFAASRICSTQCRR